VQNLNLLPTCAADQRGDGEAVFPVPAYKKA